ncbi:MAG: methylenetetrahydrofolate--tRNA-(uracil(54)-C(5))-methyltransferase (FADH(2)-oxidizing) TrmFO [Anaerolineaceae bacterium]|nr:methylenetetrahydrofolate--tRNA-(uracil(54)-C(5))-methyltransferase (FADH(2)-oxidizing) TrmFO [Anaerolineaceae bacterium]
MENLKIIGGGLAGCEAAWQAAASGIDVELYEMRPEKQTGAHQTGGLAELVCSNSFGTILPDRAGGVLKQEVKRLGSLLLACAEAAAIPAGSALAVDRAGFSSLITKHLMSHPLIHVVRQEITRLPEGVCIIASGPLTSPALSKELVSLLGEDYLFFFDAIAPIVSAESINMEIAFKASRFNRDTSDTGDYINCPFTKGQYYDFINALCDGQRISLKDFEKPINSGVKAGDPNFFEGCLPVEILAQRGQDALAFGPMRPIGLIDPNTGKRPFAVLQLRQDNFAGSLYNMVGFQTNLTFSEQKRIFRMIPGLENAQIVRYGQMHRNTYIAAPKLLKPTLEAHSRQGLFFAGQITGIEGYMGNIASGLLAGINAARYIKKQPLLELPSSTLLGALCRYITHAAMKDFQPTKANFGILPDTTRLFKNKKERASFLAERSLAELEDYLDKVGHL